MSLIKFTFKEIGTIIGLFILIYINLIYCSILFLRYHLVITRKRIIFDIDLSIYNGIKLFIWYLVTVILFLSIIIWLWAFYIMYNNPLVIDTSDVHNSLYLFPVISRSIRRGWILSTIKNRLGPVSKTMASKFNVISLIGLLSYETLYSLVFIVLFYLILLILGGLFVYLSQEDLGRISAIVSLLPITELKDNIIEPLSQFILDKTDTSTYFDKLCYYYDIYFKYYIYAHTTSFFVHILHDGKILLLSLEYIYNGEMAKDSLLAFPFNYLVHYFAYISMIFKYYWFNPLTELLTAIYHIPHTGIKGIINTTVVNELLWAYNNLDDLLAYNLCTIKTVTDNGVYEYILNKDWG